jgi:hypothetical protein
MANGAAPYGAAITFLFFGGYKAVVPTGPMTDHWFLPTKRLCPNTPSMVPEGNVIKLREQRTGYSL